MSDLSTPKERVEWLTDNYDLSERNAWALLLAELGYSSSGIAKALNVTEGTAKKYLRKLENQIGEGVTHPVTSNKPRYPVFPGDTPKSEVRYSPDHVELEPEFKERELPLNRGCDIEEIPKELITIDVEV